MTPADAAGTLTVLGLGRLGAPMAACLASRGYRVIGVDTDAERVAAVGAGRAPVFEPGLADLMAGCRDQLLATCDTGAAVGASEATFIVVPTPSTDRGDFSLQHVTRAVESVGSALRRSDRSHLVVLTSTVMPGATDGPVRAALERSSGRRVGAGIGLCYRPEFIALGSVIRDYLNPDLVLIGESDAEAGARLESIYRRVCDGAPPVVRTSFVNAELAKIGLNTFVTTRISFANTLARLCERLPGADVDAVTGAIGLDRRIGSRCLRGAVGYGGPCFPRDNRAFAALARSVGVPADIAEATDRFNRRQVALLAELVRAQLPAGGRAGVLGLSYKPGTDVAEESPGVHLARELESSGVRVLAHDPAAAGAARRALAGATIAATAASCIEGADVAVVVTPWTEYRDVPAATWARPGRPRVVVDCWRFLPELAHVPGVRYVALGRHSGE
jgi:UDPglucose 6-dehydrogenase